MDFFSVNSFEAATKNIQNNKNLQKHEVSRYCHFRIQLTLNFKSNQKQPSTYDNQVTTFEKQWISIKTEESLLLLYIVLLAQLNITN